MSMTYIESLYEDYVRNPASVDETWKRYFDSLSTVMAPPPSAVASQHVAPKGPTDAATDKALRIIRLVEAYRHYGHFVAAINPIATHGPPQIAIDALSLSKLGFFEHELTESFPSCGLFAQSYETLQNIVDALRKTYCGNIGIEYRDLQSPQIEKWLQERIEPVRCRPDLTVEERQQILMQLNKSELFESFLHTKYTGQKRFSLEGGESLIPMLSAIIDAGALLKAEEFYIGMAHRGRLNVLSNILNKSYGELFNEFEDITNESFEGSGDVKYHKGYSSEVFASDGTKIKLTLADNPSHLEAVDAVITGQVRARQVQRGEAKKEIVPILIHGDAAIAGQGIVLEVLQLCKLSGYGTGGTIHIVINNQIGFTTLPKDSRSTHYCTDIAKAFSAPVFHVNGEDPEGCVYAAKLALELRQTFGCDVFLELNCYRKYGHNEGDEPAFTQPLEYQSIAKKKPVRELYRDLILRQGVVEKYMVESLEKDFKDALSKAQAGTKSFASNGSALKKEAHPSKDELEQFQKALLKDCSTGVDAETLRNLCTRFCTVPEGFLLHKKLQKLLEQRKEMLAQEPKKATIDWGLGEHLAFATILHEKIHLRISGQDSRRGTFSHRHATWIDQGSSKRYFPLSRLSKDQGRFDVFNSPLSEYAVLGFEFGYSLVAKDALVIWEAQFGDFCNGAQIVIDQFLATAEQKWGRTSRLCLFLPHGYEGQGPEHSSARMERFLQLCGDFNMQVVSPTTPAQLFHLLRRQVIRPLAKPLIVFTPKGLLRHPDCMSSLSDFTSGHFEEIIDDPKPPKKPKRLVLCNGRLYYDLLKERESLKAKEVAIVRIEQLYPLHTQKLSQLLENYKSATDIIWAQDEPKNMGAWAFISARVNPLLAGKSLRYCGRSASASPAVGSYSVHKKEHAQIIKSIFDGIESKMKDLSPASMLKG